MKIFGLKVGGTLQASMWNPKTEGFLFRKGSNLTNQRSLDNCFSLFKSRTIEDDLVFL